MKELLEQGKVPSEPILDEIRRYVAVHGEDSYVAVLEGIASRSGVVTYNTLDTWLRRPERCGPMRFQVADELLCAINRWDLWYSDLEEIYQAVDLNWKKCERDGCKTWFHLSPRANHHRGRRRRRYCTSACGQMAWLAETGKIKNSAKYNRKTHCRNGHKRSEAGTNADGNCKACVDAKNAEMRLKHSEKRREYQKKWYAENKEKKVEYQKRWREKRRIQGVAA